MVDQLVGLPGTTEESIHNMVYVSMKKIISILLFLLLLLLLLLLELI